MLDVKFVSEHLETVRQMLRSRHNTLNLDAFTDLEQQRRALITQADALKQERNATSKSIGAKIKQGEDVSAIKAEVGKIGARIKELDQELRDTQQQLNDLLAAIPNMLDPTVPHGDGEDDNVEVARWGTPREFSFAIKDHVDLGTNLKILDLETAAKTTGARFALLRGQGAQLERALIQFMIDVHVEQGYFEVLPPFVVNSQALFGTGQFPKMKEDVFKLEETDYYLIPTAEVPVTNIHQGEILAQDQLPIRYQAFTPCFRSEAGAHGKDTRGLIRQHQFNKVEMVKFVHPDESEAHLETLRADAEEILRRLELPYRVMSLCSADLSFSARKCYDLEVWLPGQEKYREISSCSNFWDFQARRAKIRFKDEKSGKNLFVHTLNGSGLAIGRTWVAILENHQCQDGRVRIPDALRPYMNGTEFIEKQPQ